MSDYIITGEAVERWDLPTAIMAQEIVRCKDCKHYISQGTYHFNGGVVNRDTCKVIRGFVVQIGPNGFCAWGERRE